MSARESRPFSRPAINADGGGTRGGSNCSTEREKFSGIPFGGGKIQVSLKQRVGSSLPLAEKRGPAPRVNADRKKLKKGAHSLLGGVFFGESENKKGQFRGERS